MPGSLRCFLLSFTAIILYAFLIPPICVTYLAYFILILVTLGKKYKLWSSSLCSFLHPTLTFCWIQIFSSASCSDVVSLCSSLRVKRPSFIPVKIISQHTVLYILIFIILRRLETVTGH
jgi:hypothetical protein